MWQNSTRCKRGLCFCDSRQSWINSLGGGVNTHVIGGFNTTVRQIFCHFPCFVRFALPSATLALTSWEHALATGTCKRPQICHCKMKLALCFCCSPARRPLRNSVSGDQFGIISISLSRCHMCKIGVAFRFSICSSWKNAFVLLHF